MHLEEAKEVIRNSILNLKKEKTERIFRITIKIDYIDILSWLSAQSSNLKKVYWRDRDANFLCAGIGEAVFIRGSEFPEYKYLFKNIFRYLAISSPGVKFYGGFCFPSSIREKEWEKFNRYYFFIPLFELIKEPDGMYFACNIKLPLKDVDMILDILKEIKLGADELTFPLSCCRYIYRKDIPDINEWEKDVNNILEEINNNKLVKVVLARKTTFKLNQPFDVYSFFKDPRWKKEKTYHFLIQLSSSIFFIGISPERIYFKNGNYIETEAIAGTRGRGVTEEEDRRFVEELKKSPKELKEHRLVSNVLKEKMTSLCDSVILKSNEEILKLSYTQHLYTKFSGKLISGISDDKIISTLYPNPAIAGYPIDDSLKKIREIERFDRGWYSGPFGWITHNSAEFIVSIRSALIIEDFMHLYSGAGLVSGSNYLYEWKELDNKILNFTKMLKNA